MRRADEACTTGRPVLEQLEPRLLLSTLHVDNFPADGTWPGCYTDLQAALADATAGDEVWVAAGTYRPTDTTERSISFEMVGGVALYGGFVGGETSRDQRDWEANETVLSGDIGTPEDNSDNSYHVVRGADDAVLDGFIVTGGCADGEGEDSYGGGMYNSHSSPTVTNCTLVGNSAGDAQYGGGGGMYNYYAYPAVTNCRFIDNWINDVDNGGGGAMYNYCSSPRVVDCAFDYNSVEWWFGGGRGGECATRIPRPW